MKVYWFATIAALLWGIAPVFEKTGLVKVSPLTGLSVRTLAVTLGLTIAVLATGGWREFHTLDTKAIAYIAIGGLIAGGLAQFAYYWALKYGEASKIVPIVTAYPLIAAILAALFLKEPLTPGKVIGAVLIVLGVLAVRLG